MRRIVFSSSWSRARQAREIEDEQLMALYYKEVVRIYGESLYGATISQRG